MNDQKFKVLSTFHTDVTRSSYNKL